MSFPLEGEKDGLIGQISLAMIITWAPETFSGAWSFSTGLISVEHI